MKKIALSLFSVAVLSTTASYAQARLPLGTVAIAPEAGLYMANLSLKTYDNRVSTSIKKSFTFGASVDHGFTDHIYIQSGLFYAANGCNVTDVGWYKINTLQIPLTIEYKLGDPGGNRFFVGAGPYIGYFFSGTGKINDSSAKLKIGSDKKTDDVKAIDFGLGLHLGLLLSNNFYAHIQYLIGINNLTPGGDATNITRTSGIGITIGYYFGNSRPQKSKKKKATGYYKKPK